MINEIELKPCRIKVIGAGGGGGNAINRMIENGLNGVEFCVMNTDLQALNSTRAENKIQLGINATKGLGAGGNPVVGERAADESKEQIKEYLKDTDIVFLTAGMGGGTGTGSIPIIAQIAKELGILTIAIVTKPFGFEGKHRMKQAREGVAKLKEHVDSIIVVQNNKLRETIANKCSLSNAFLVVDNILARAVQGITCTITNVGLMNIDFADVKSVMENSENAIMAIGVAEGVNRATEAVDNAMHSINLSEVSLQSAANARGLIVNIVAGDDLTLQEVYDTMAKIEKLVSPETKVKVGAVIDEKIRGAMEVNLIATGFSDAQEYVEPPKLMTNTFFNKINLPKIE